MAGFVRHVRALTRKNWVNWYRTWLGSILEILFPCLCMYFLTLMYRNANPISNQKQEFLDMAWAQYPVTNPVGIRWVTTNEQPSQIKDFLEFANITTDPSDFYKRNPGYFYPEHCYGYGSFNPNYTAMYNETDNQAAPRRNFTAIGYIAANNQIERDVITQLKLIFAQQQKLFPGVYHNYQIIKFNSMMEVHDYVKDPQYTFDAKKPGLCYAFWINKLSDSRFDISLMFNDQFNSDFMSAGIPRQADAVWDPIRPQANTKAFYKYMTGGYSIMQNLIANTILRSVTNQNASIAMITVPQNQQPYSTDPLIEQILIQWLPLAMLFAYLFPVFRITQRMVAEKETQVRDSMRMMGLNEFAYWTSWLLYYFLINVIVSSLCTLVLFQTLFKHSSVLIVWLFFFMYGLSLFGFVTFAQAFFQNARYSAVFSSLLYLSLYGVNQLVGSSDVLESGKNWASLIPQVALSLMVPHLGAYEAVGIGLNFNNINQVYLNYKFSNGYLMLLLDFCVLTILGIYLDNVMPRETGMQKPLSFGFSYLRASYWDFFDLCQCKKRKSSQKYIFMRDAAKRKAELEDHDFKSFETKYMNPENFEAPDLSLHLLEKKRRFLKILDLKKQYGNGQKAVDGINLRMYEGQIFALLGHNGAGKTTTIQMMTGMVEPTEGEAFVYGYRVFSAGDMDELRKYMGVCPQHNVLFDLLTPYDTLRVFQNFKGAQGTRTEKDSEIQKLLQDVGLWEDRKTLGKNLSGGMKRKLSVAIALCGQSKFVMLDEPTAGMDLQARRNLWNMLRAYRNDRIIILTTHYMDEADVLGDRIGIMQNGRLVTVGSSLFLKKRYGVGYNFQFEKLKSDVPFNIEKIDTYLKEKLSQEIKLLSDVGDEVKYQVPTECSNKFKEFFTEFDQNLQELQIQGYGISVTSLEEVFLRVGTEAQDIPALLNNDNLVEGLQAQVNQIEMEKQKMYLEYSVADKKKYNFNFFTNVRAMCFKRCKLEKRRWKSVIFLECLIPILFVLTGVWITQIRQFYDSPNRLIQTKLYPLPQRILMDQEPVINSTLASNTTYEDYISIPPIVDNFPSSYTLLTDNDFEVTYHNYTDEYLEGVQQRANGSAASDTFNYFSSFNDDVYDMRLYGDVEPFRFGSYLVYQADPARHLYKIINYVNTTSQDVAAAYPQFMYEAILKTATNQSNFQFKMTTAPFPISQRYRDQEQQTSVISLIAVVAIGLSMIPANIIGAILRERVRNLKHLQLISGLNLVAYHLINIFFDIIKAQFVVGCCCSMFFIFKLTDYYWSLLIMGLWPIGIIPITHAFGFLFNKEWQAQLFIVILNLVVLCGYPIYISQILFNEKTIDLAEYLNTIGLFFLPGYSMPRAMLFCGYQNSLDRFKKSIGRGDEIQDVWSFNNFKSDLIAISSYHLLGVLLILTADNVLGVPTFLKSCKKKSINIICKLNIFARKGFQKVEAVDDDDVTAEEERVEKLKKDELQVRVSNFSKIYNKGLNRVLAVRKASFGVSFGECFTLLGVNGAGKTTTFKSLTSETEPTNGEVSIGGFDITKSFAKARKLIGYCPQENVLFDQLTVEEHIFFYALLKGIPSKFRRQLCEYTIKEMDLFEQRKKQSQSLSGGNKRKLQVAIAIIGNPPIILLDEPSAGMDPQARRFMWSVIANLNKKREKCAVILTTHSMEEAEALGTKLGIMVRGGQFRCFGSSQHIKNKFGTGFEVEIKIKPPTQEQTDNFVRRFNLTQAQSKIVLMNAIELMRESTYPEQLIAEIRSTGLGDELVRESRFDTSGNIRVKHLVEWVHNMQHGTRAIRCFAKEFGQVTLLEQFSDYFKLRFAMNDKSIGYVFGLIEQNKDYFGIAEYSVSQTTLEQIFQMFANSKRADAEDVEELDKIKFDYQELTETNQLQLVITRQSEAKENKDIKKNKKCLLF